MTIYSDITEKLMQFFSTGEFQDEAIKAKIQFNDYAGVFDEAAADFEMKLSQFVDWFLFTRKLQKYGLSPIGLQIERGLMPMSDEERAFYVNLAGNRHSLFEFLKITKEDLHVRDLFSDYKLVIKKSPVVDGFNRDEPFEARLVPHGDSFVFASAFCFHPKESTKYILQEVKKVKKLGDDERPAAREALLLKLFKMRHKYDQYRHVAVGEIYTNESRLRF